MATLENEFHDQEAALKRLRALSRILDGWIEIPGTHYRVGLDAILGLLPGVGDLLGAVLSFYILGEALRMGLSRVVIARIFFNIAVDLVGGAVPLAGDVFDFAWKSNQWNVALIERDLQNTRSARRGSWLYFAGWMAAALLVLALAVAVVIFLLQSLHGFLSRAGR